MAAPEMADLVRRTVAAVNAPGKAARSAARRAAAPPSRRRSGASCTRIPAGETRTYAQIAAAVGRPAAVRAAGTANGDNNVAVLIPCHRVIRTDGTLGGYAYGLERKAKLLAQGEPRLALAACAGPAAGGAGVRQPRLEPGQHLPRGFARAACPAGRSRSSRASRSSPLASRLSPRRPRRAGRPPDG